MNRIKAILVGVDFSEGSHAALHQARQLATATHAALHVLPVIDGQALAELAGALIISPARNRANALAPGRTN